MPSMSPAPTAAAAPAPRRAAALPAGSRRAETSLGLRERKKIKTRQAIRHAAYRLFAEQGYDATTVERIAAAAEVSTSTFFRYFAAKEDVVLTDEYGPLMEQALLARPAGEPVARSLRAAAECLVRELPDDPAARGELLQRLVLVLRVPAIRARMGENLLALADLLAGALHRGTERPCAEELRTRVLVGAVLGACQQAMLQWAAGGGTEALPELMEQVFDTLAEGFGAAAPPPPARS